MTSEDESGLPGEFVPLPETIVVDGCHGRAHAFRQGKLTCDCGRVRRVAGPNGRMMYSPHPFPEAA